MEVLHAILRSFPIRLFDNAWVVPCVGVLCAVGCQTADGSDYTYGMGGAVGSSGGVGSGATSSGGTAGAGADATGATSGAIGSQGGSGAGSSSSGGSVPSAGGTTSSGGAGAGGSGGTEAPGGAGNTGDAGSSGSDAGPDCDADEKLCDDTCVAISDPAYGCGAATCDASGCPSTGTGGTLACDRGACVVDTCPTNYKKCGDRCASVTDPSYGCGTSTCDDASCPAPGSGTLVCQNGSCVIGTCGSGTKKCGDKCVTADANNGCSEAARCTPCAQKEACTGSPTTCQCVPTAMATACSGKCGTVSNGCGGTYTCGTCTSPQTCGGGGTANVCGCTPTAISTACANKNCGMVSNGCGGTHTCGTCTSPQTCGSGATANTCRCPSNQTICGNLCCSGSTPICAAGACRQCAVFADCPAGSFDCSNNTCVCRTPSSANAFKDGGFDTAAALSSWTSSGTVWTSSDADGCPGSGSVTVTGTISRCYQNATAGAEYALGFRYKQPQDDGSGCLGMFYQDRNCSVPTGTPEFLNTGAATATATWSPSFSQGIAPEGTRSILVQCTGDHMSLDQIFLRTPVTTGAGF